MRPLVAVLSVALFAVLACTLLAAPSCGGTSIPEPSGSPASERTTAPPAPVTDETASTAPVTTDGFDAVHNAFASLALSVEPLPIFAPTYLPTDVVLAESWWPMVEYEDPNAFPGPPQLNPHVIDDGSLPQVELIVESGNGWIDFLQNFRGDVGDSAGRDVGEVAGLPAALFAMGDGLLVQWQHDGLWYGIFARGVAEQELLRVAGGMGLVEIVKTE